MKKRFLVIFVSAMLAAVGLTAAACKEKETPPPAPSGGVELSAAALDLDVREKATLTAVAENGEPVAPESQAFLRKTSPFFLSLLSLSHPASKPLYPQNSYCSFTTGML